MAKFKSKRKDLEPKNPKWEKKLIFGISKKTFLNFKKTCGINKNLPLENFEANHKIKRRYWHFIRKLNVLLDRDLLKAIKDDLQFIRQISNFTYSRHKFKLPARGQRSRTNAKTQKRKKFSSEKK